MFLVSLALIIFFADVFKAFLPVNMLLLLLLVQIIAMLARAIRKRVSRAVGTTVQFTLAVFLISLAVSVYFAEPIRVVIPINLLLLLILVHIVYVLIRWYVKGCMRSRGYY